MGVDGGDASHSQCGFTAGDAAIHYNHRGCIDVLMSAGATAPCKLPMSLLNKRIDVEGCGQGRVVDFDGSVSSMSLQGGINSVGKGEWAPSAVIEQ